MPIEYTKLKGKPETFWRCPNCGIKPFRSDTHLRGTVQSGLRKFFGLAYCAVICAACGKIVGHERPPKEHA